MLTLYDQEKITERLCTLVDCKKIKTTLWVIFRNHLPKV